MDNITSSMEKMILDSDFIYEPPYFYNNDLALRCELGIGKSNKQYMATAKKRAAEIYGMLFEKGVDMFFFDDYICDYDYDSDDDVKVNIGALTEFEKRRLKFCLKYQKRYRHKIVRDIPFDKECTDIIRRNRICCYANKKLDAVKDVINTQIDGDFYPTAHLVSFSNNCILSVYDDRGCDVVFYDKKAFVKFYPLLQKYFLDHDRELMDQRLKASLGE